MVYPNLYKKVDIEKITVNGEASPNSEVYNLKKNQYLIRLNITPLPETIYIIDYDKQIVGSPPGNDTGLYFFAGYLYSLHGEFRMIPLNGTLAKTDFFDAKLALRRKYCQFTTLQGNQIRINYRLNNPMT
jgi:hypothetical protein